MPHYKCMTCMTRLRTVGGHPGSCERCGTVVEPVGGLPELVGFRLVAPRRDERFELAVAMAIQGLDTARPGPHPSSGAR